MNRYKFRGLSFDGHWRIGNLTILTQDCHGYISGSYISNSVGLPFAYAVRPDSVGQFTGFRDLKDVEIFEGDIVEMERGCMFADYTHRCSYERDWSAPVKCKELIVWEEEPATYFAGSNTLSEVILGYDYRNVVVIGNIYQQPELMRG